jgi:hypothetical protein
MKDGAFTKVFGGAAKAMTWIAILGVICVLFIYGCRRYLENTHRDATEHTQPAQ